MTFPQVGHVLLASLVMTMASVSFSDPLAGPVVAPSTGISVDAAKKILDHVKSGARNVLLILNFPSEGAFKEVKFAIISGTVSLPETPSSDLTKAVVFETAKEANTLVLYKPVYLKDKWPKLIGAGLTSGTLTVVRDKDKTPFLLIFKDPTLYRFNLHHPELDPIQWTPAPQFTIDFFKTVLFSTSDVMTVYALSATPPTPPASAVITMIKGTFKGASLAASGEITKVIKPKFLCKGTDVGTFTLAKVSCTAGSVPWKITAGFIGTDSVYLFDSASKSVIKFPHARLSSKDGQPIKYETFKLKDYLKYSETVPTTVSSTLSTARPNLNPVTKAAVAKPETTDISIRTWIYVIVSLLSVAVFLALLIAVIGCVLCRKSDQAKKQQQGPSRGPTGAGGSSMDVKAGRSSIGAKADGSSMDVKSQLPGSKMTPKCGTKSSLGPHNIGAGQPKVGKQGSAQKVGKMKQGGHN